MSTTFGVLKPEYQFLSVIVKDDESYHNEDYCIPIAFRYGIGNGRVAIDWLNELAPLLPDFMMVFPLDNTAQGVDVIKDLKNLKQEYYSI